MPCLISTRSVSVGTKSIKLWIPTETDECCCGGDQDADETAMLAATLADEDDDVHVLAFKLVRQLRQVNAAEVTCQETGDGAIFRDDSFEDN